MVYKVLYALILVALVFGAVAPACAEDTAAPVINSVTVAPWLVSVGELVHVTVSTTDDTAVTSVKADDVSLTHTGADIWEGNVPVKTELVTNFVTVISSDAAGNSATDTSGTYRTTSVYGIANETALNGLMQTASNDYLFRVWGKATFIDENTFSVSDGSAYWVKVVSQGHTVCSDDFVAAMGTLDPSAPPAVLTCRNYQIIQMAPRKPINIGNTTVGKDLQASLTGTLPEMVPYGTSLKVTISSSDSSKVLLAKTASEAGSGTIVVTVPGGSSGIPTFYVQGLAASGTIDVSATAPGGYGKVFTVTLVPSGFYISSPGNFSTTTFSNNTNIYINSCRLNPTTLAYAANQNVRAGISVSVPVTSSDTSVGAITTSPVVFNGNVGTMNTGFDPASAGTTNISLGTPEGFTTPSNYQQVTATVTAPNINAGDVTVGKDLQASSTISLSAAPPAPVDVTVSVDSASTAVVSKDANTAGTGSVTFTGVNTTTVGTIYVQGITTGTTTLTVSAEGYSTRTRTITVDPSGFVINSPTSISTTTFSSNTNVQIASCRLNPSTLAYAANQNVRAGKSVSVAVTSSDTSIGTITTSPVTFNGNVGTAATAFDPINAGTTTVSIDTPEGFSTPASSQQITATVTAPNINASNVTVGKNLQTSSSITLSAAPPSAVTVNVSVSPSTVAVLNKDANTLGDGSISFTNVTGTSVGTFYVQGLSVGTATLTISATGYNTCTKTITVDPSGFMINSPSSISTTPFSSNTTIQINSCRLNPTTLAWSSNQNLRPGISVSVPVTSLDTNVGTITISPVVFNGNIGLVNTAFHPVGAGTTTVSIGTPDGFSKPTNYQQIAAVVTLPNITASDSTVGRDLQTSNTISLTAAPPSAVDVTVTVESPSVATVTRTATAEGTGTLTVTGVTSTSVGTIYVQGRSLGTTNLIISAPGYNTCTKTITVDPSGFIINSPTAISTTATSGNTNVQIASARLNPSDFRWVSNQPVRGGLTVNVPVASSNTAVGAITISPVAIGPNVGTVNTAFDPIAVGTCVVSAEAPAGFSVPTTYRTINATVK